MSVSMILLNPTEGSETNPEVRLDALKRFPAILKFAVVMLASKFIPHLVLFVEPAYGAASSKVLFVMLKPVVPLAI
jgi:hypothetical protein